MHKFTILPGKERHSIDAVATVKKMQDRFKRIHIYEVNDCMMNNQPLYIFKTSTLIAKIALLMDQDHEEKMLRERLYNINFVAAQSCDLPHAVHHLYGL